MGCEFCLHADDKHENSCPAVNGKMAEWQAGYGAAKENDMDCEPLVETADDGRLIPRSDLTYGLGWAVAMIDTLKPKS